MIKVNDKFFRCFIVIIPFLVGVFVESISEKPFGTSWPALAVLSLSTIILVCEGNRFIIYGSRRFFYKKYKLPFRMLMVITAGLLYTTCVIAINMVLENFIRKGEWSTVMTGRTNLYLNDTNITIGLTSIAFFYAILLFFPLLLFNEGIYHFARLRHSEKARDQLEKEKLRAELQQLKGIINPHFLFNNLNSLSSLISENPVQAEAFLDELTKVFRYLLRNNDTELTTLKQEVEFIGSYYHLLQTRYGNSITLLLQLEKEYEELMVPPLTLQLLVENAVKHNRLHREKPLRIELAAIPGKRLLVRNNINKKEGAVESNGIGLQSINARYRMLNLPGIIIEKDAVHFSVIIPLVEPAPGISR